ncbi:MAG: PD-(D/E)XK nuclease family protein [Planctomycetaceae bacterium]
MARRPPAPATPATEGAPPAATPPSPCRRHRLDAAAGVLAAAAAWLLERCAAAPAPAAGVGRVADLSEWLVVLPGRAAGLRLNELLVAATAARGLALVPPRITTPGDLPECLYAPGKTLTDTLLETLCWAGAIAAAPPRDRELLGAGLGDPDEAPAGDRLIEAGAGMVALHRELASHGLDFSSFATTAAAKLPAFADDDRWSALARLEHAYLGWLKGLDAWDRQTARRKAIGNGEIACPRHVVLVATVDLDPLQRNLLAALPGGCDALVAAPPTMSDANVAAAFDDYGCLVPAFWESAPIPIPLDAITVVEDAAGQSEAVVAWLHSLGGRRAADEITIAAPDDLLVPELEHRLRAVGLAGRAAGGRMVERATPWQLLDAILAWLADGDFAAFARLLRCPDAARLLTARTGIDLPAAVADTVANRHLPLAIDRRLLARAAAESPDPAETGAGRFLALLDAADEWLAELVAATRAVGKRVRRGGTEGGGRAAAWAAAVRGVIGAAVGDRVLDRDAPDERTVVVALESLGEWLAEFEALPDELVAAVGPAGIRHLLLTGWGRRLVPPLPDAEAIPIVGWLEVALDDAPALAITSVVEGVLPGGVGRDPLLPDPLRQAVGLPDTDRTAARDAWSLALAATCRRELLVVVPRHRVDGGAAIPSRLLFRRPAAELVAAVQTICHAAPSPTVSGTPGLARRLPIPDPDVFAPWLPRHPRPAAEDEPAGTAVAVFATGGERHRGGRPALSVTALRNYVSCPYRFWLKHVVGLRAVTDDALELGALEFGTLLHDCLQRFAVEPAPAGSTDAAALTAALTGILDDLVAARFGPSALPAVEVQAALARRRLAAFAERQAARSAEGWRIVATERDVCGTLDVDGTAVPLVARIDRIDHHPATDRWQILDYKTSSRARPPDQVHRKRGVWIDFQLPLYRHLAGAAGLAALAAAPAGAIDVGFFNLPARPEDTDVSLAEWTDDDQSAALAAATEAIRGIRAGRYWPPNDAAAPSFPEFDAICQTHAIVDEGDDDE